MFEKASVIKLAKKLHDYECSYKNNEFCNYK